MTNDMLFKLLAVENVPLPQGWQAKQVVNAEGQTIEVLELDE